MAVISDSLRSPDRHYSLVNISLQRVPTEVGRVVSLLNALPRMMLEGPGIPEALRAKLQRCFGIRRDDPTVLMKAAYIRGTYERAARVIQSPRCLISRITDPAFADIWGFSPVPPDFAPAAGFDSEIQVGTAFLDGNDTAFNPAVQQCGVFQSRDLNLLRVTTLVHEAVHWLRVFGHDADNGAFFSPDSYEMFMVDSGCSTPADVIERTWSRTPLGQSTVPPSHFSPRRDDIHLVPPGQLHLRPPGDMPPH